MIDIQAPTPEVAPEPVVPDYVNTGGNNYGQQGEFDARRGTTGYSRRVPWGTAKHVKSHEQLDKYGSAREALVATGLDWEVNKVPLFTKFSDEGVELQVEDFQAVTRSDNGYTLGVVKGRYAPWQNRRLAEFTDTLVSVDGEAAALGESFEGRKVWSVVQLPDIDSPDGGLGTFLVVSNSHDGSSSISATFVTVRWACTNGLIALAKAAHTVKIRHTSTMEARLAEAHKVLAVSTTYVEDTTDLMNDLLSTPVTAKDADRFVRNSLVALPDTDNERVIRNTQKKQDELLATWANSDNLEGVRDTGWGFVNAVAEWNEWTGSHVRRRRLDPMERLLNESGQDIVHQARDLVLA